MTDTPTERVNGCAAASRAVAEIEADLRTFEAEERRRLGLVEDERQAWRDPDVIPFTEEQRTTTTILFGGLTRMHEALLEASFTRFGYKVKALDCPDTAALQWGKEFGNRGQCNPTYFTVGNLLKYLLHLRDDQGMDPADIVQNYVFVTIGACGPCRLGSYITEYRKVLRDAGFGGFRIMDVRKFGEHKRDPNVAGLKLDLPITVAGYKCVIAGDVMNLIACRIRPYEIVPGASDAAIEECREILCDAVRKGRSVWRALRRSRKLLDRVEVNRLLPKPKVAIIGEFWAMTTEGDGNYQLQRFLESEGAECEIQPVSNFLLYELWEVIHDTRERMMLRHRDGRKHEAENDSPLLTLAACRLIDFVSRATVAAYARAVGLKHYHLPDMNHLARIARKMYPIELRGGEGHLEVAKVIEAVSKNKAHMVVTVKPFGCMPSSGVSDGIQSLVTARYPEVNLCAIETSGDGAVGVYSRVQMALFKARARAREEYEKALADNGIDDPDRLSQGRRRGKLTSAIYYPRHKVAGTAANALYELGGK
jgi:predicted nucleotide-binding protein (sugar kinase/HSP70/actin superfamily)